MVALVTVEQVNNALRLDLDLGDPPAGDGDADRIADIESKIEQATDIVLDYLKMAPDDVWTIETVPPRVSAAIIIVVRCLLDDSEDSLAMLSGLSGADLSNPIVALLYRLRDPAIA